MSAPKNRPSAVESPSRPALLGPEDPPPFEVVNGDGAAPLLLLCDHASNVVPRALDGLGLSHADLHRHIAWDIGAAEVSRILSARFDAPLVQAGYSRLVADCNRDADDPTFIVEVSEDTVISGNRGLSVEEVARFFKAVPSLKHRTILMLAYGAGLRVGEAVRVRLSDIDRQRKVLRVSQGKGKKDRYTVLSPVLLEMLDRYCCLHRPDR